MNCIIKTGLYKHYHNTVSFCYYIINNLYYYLLFNGISFKII